MPIKHSTIAVVDDDVAIAQFIKASLKEEGFDVLLAATGKEALRVIEEGVPDLVILDIMLPQFDGFEVRFVTEKKVLR